jgi:hypothetical protein
LQRCLAMLREIGVTAAKPPEPRSCRQRFVDEYRRYLLRERGLAAASLLNYLPFAEQRLSSRFRLSDIDPSELTAMDVTKFVRDRVHHLSHGRAKLLVTALRSFLRYLRQQGEISIDLAGCVPAVPVWSSSTLRCYSKLRSRTQHRELAAIKPVRPILLNYARIFGYAKSRLCGQCRRLTDPELLHLVQKSLVLDV